MSFVPTFFLKSNRKHLNRKADFVVFCFSHLAFRKLTFGGLRATHVIPMGGCFTNKKPTSSLFCFSHLAFRKRSQMAKTKSHRDAVAFCS